MPGVLPRAPLYVGHGKLLLDVPRDLEGLVGERLNARMKALGRLIGREAMIRIVDPQENFSDLSDVSVGDLLRWSPLLRKAMNERYSFVHPENDNIKGCTHIMWTGKPQKPGSTMS